MKIFFFLIVLIFISCNTSINNKANAVRGTWITNVDSDVLSSREKIIEAINFCDEIGINTIFPVVWSKGITLYPSTVMRNLTGAAIDPSFEGRDPLKELIEEADKKNIKVIAWFEFGFSPSFSLNEGEILSLKPEWAAKDIAGNLVVKNGLQWMNGFDPEVQDFILSLIMEVVRKYDLDGIQGDDRLPAMPSEAGYDEYTIKFYRSQHNGNLPPEDPKDTAWVQWRADILTDFMKRIYSSVKSVNKNLIVSIAPSLYPWSKEEYLQEWTRWVNEGYVDLVTPQIYRYELDSYIFELDKIVNGQIDPAKQDKIYPGILLNVGNYFPSEGFLRQMIEENRKRGINGEVFFFYEGLKRFPELFKNVFYNEKADFPHLTKRR